MNFSDIINKYWPEFYSYKSVSSLCKAIDRQLTKNKHVPSMDVFTTPFKILTFDKIKCVFLAETLITSKQRNTYITNGILFSSHSQFAKHQSTSNLHAELLRTHPDSNIKSHGDLSEWCERGIFMIPVRFTFDPEFKQEYQFWNMFTSALLEFLYEKNKDIVVVLFGSAMREFLKSGSMKKCYFELIHVPHPSASTFVGSRLFQLIDAHYKNKRWEVMEW